MNFRIDGTRFVVIGVVTVLSASVFLLQHELVLFGKGHLGWVSSHTLSIIRNATPDRGFLGFSCHFLDERGMSYFDRYPVVFSGVMNVMLKPFDNDIGEYISRARLYMNVIYVLCILVGYQIALVLTGDRLVSLLASIFTFMGVFFVYYKEMIHFDQPAILGMMLLFLAICRYELKNESAWVWVAVGVVLLGRGYASNFLLLLWNIIHIAPLVWHRQFRLGRYLRSIPFLVFVLGGVLSGGALASNVLSEARIKGVPWHETSIVKSASFRLTFHSRPEHSKQAALVPFTFDQLKRTMAGFVPYALLPYAGKGNEGVNPFAVGAFLTALMGLGAYSFLRTDLIRRAWNIRKLVLLGLLSGFFWLFPLRNLAAFHNYTAMYNAVFYIVMFSAIFYGLRSRRSAYGVLALGGMLFIVSLVQLNSSRAAYNDPANAINDDVDRIRSYLGANGIDAIWFPGGYRRLIDGSPYAACLYFSEFRIADEPSHATVMITRSSLPEQELVPDTSILNVYPVR